MKTLENIMREKFATGFDPVTLRVSPRGLNEESIEVVIEELKYIVKGNDLSYIGGVKRGYGEYVHSVGGFVDDTHQNVLPEDGNTVAAIEDPVDPTPPDHDVSSQPLEKILNFFAGEELRSVSTTDQGETFFNVLDAAGDVVAEGTFHELLAIVEHGQDQAE